MFQFLQGLRRTAFQAVEVELEVAGRGDVAIGAEVMAQPALHQLGEVGVDGAAVQRQVQWLERRDALLHQQAVIERFAGQGAGVEVEVKGLVAQRDQLVQRGFRVVLGLGVKGRRLFQPGDFLHQFACLEVRRPLRRVAVLRIAAAGTVVDRQHVAQIGLQQVMDRLAHVAHGGVLQHPVKAIVQRRKPRGRIGQRGEVPARCVLQHGPEALDVVPGEFLAVTVILDGHVFVLCVLQQPRQFAGIAHRVVPDPDHRRQPQQPDHCGADRHHPLPALA